MQDVKRRQFMLALAAGAMSAGMCSCASSSEGGAGGARAATAEGGAIDLGPLAELKGSGSQPAASFIRRGHVILVHDDNRLYALSSTCTHRKCDVKPLSEGGSLRMQCPCHGARYDLRGEVTKGPATKPLPLYAISLDSHGHLRVDPSRQFDATDRENPATYIALDS